MENRLQDILKIKTINLYLFEVIFFILLLSVASLIYLKPLLDVPNNYILLGGGDDSTYGLLTQKILKHGITGGYDLTFPPFLPILMAFFHKFVAFSIEDAGRIVTSLAIIFTPIPTYFLAKNLFGIRAAVIAAILIISWPMSNISFGFARPQALQTFMMTTAFFISFLALKKGNIFFYFIAGAFWGLSYLTRFESWLPFLVLLALTLTQLSERKSLKNTLVKVFLAVLGFLIITFSYLSYVHDTFGSWTINPRIGIDVVAPGGVFAVIDDPKGKTTLAQLMLSGEPTYFQYGLWHPDTRTWLISFGRNKLFDSTLPSLYIGLLNKYSQELAIAGSLGIFLSVVALFRKNTRPLILLLTVITFIYSTINLMTRIFANLPQSNQPIWWENIRNLISITFVKYNDSFVSNNLNLMIITSFLIYWQRKSIGLLLNFFRQNHLSLF